jgi:hypothetical protein
MANKKILAGMLSIVLTFGMTVVGCDDGNTETGPQVETFIGTANGTTYTLKITDGATYELTVGSKTSSGSVAKSGGTYTLTPSNGDAFTITGSGGGITAISGTITFDDNTTAAAPETVTPSSPPTGSKDVLDGTKWKTSSADGPDGSGGMRITFTSPNWSGKGISDNTEYYKGTYTVEGETITFTLTHFGGEAYNGQAPDPVEITGNTFEFLGDAFTKE